MVNPKMRPPAPRADPVTIPLGPKAYRSGFSVCVKAKVEWLAIINRKDIVEEWIVVREINLGTDLHPGRFRQYHSLYGSQPHGYPAKVGAAVSQFDLRIQDFDLSLNETIDTVLRHEGSSARDGRPKYRCRDYQGQKKPDSFSHRVDPPFLSR
jgi:hypothetical protein